MKKLYFLILVIAPFIIESCTSGKKAFEQGNYYQSVLKSINRLRQNPNHKKSIETLRQSYPLAVETMERDITNIINSNAPFKYRETVAAYEQINVMYEQIRRAPGALRVIPNPKNYYSQIDEYKRKAAKESYDAGLIALNRKTRQDAKDAYFMFVDADRFIPGYEDVRNKIEEAHFIATLKVVVDQIPVPTRYTLSGGFFQDKVEEYLHTQFRSTQFVRFYTPAEAQTERLEHVDQYLRLQFDDFTVGETHTTKNTEAVSRDSVKVGTVKVGEKTIDAYNTVYAKLTTFKKEVISRGLLSMRVYDGKSNAVLTHQKFNGEFVWFSQWGSFNGDERALTDEELAICKLNEVPPPPHQEMFIEFTRPIYDRLIPALSNFYGRY